MPRVNKNKEKKTERFRAFAFTNYKLENDYQKVVDEGKVLYMCYGDEVCPTTQRKHHQGWAYFKNQKSSYKEVATLLGVSHVEGMRGSLSQNDDYCSKEGAMKHFGTRPTPGERLDLEDIKQRIMEGESVDELTMWNPELFHQYGRTLSKIEQIQLRKKFRTWMTVGKWYYGPTGTGKSHTAFEDFTPEDCYVKNLSDDWWDGYVGQPRVILNDFRGQIKYEELLCLVDKWPHTVKQRNREPVPFLARELIVTSSLHPALLYESLKKEDSIDQLLRRFVLKTGS